MEHDRGGRAVEPRQWTVGFAMIGHLSEEIPRRVLRSGSAERVPETPVGHRRLVLAPGPHRKAAEHHHPETLGEGSAPSGQTRRQLGQRDPGGVDCTHRGAGLEEPVGQAPQLVQFGIGENDAPAVGGQVLTAPRRRMEDRTIGSPHRRAGEIAATLLGERANRCHGVDSRRGTG